MKVTINRLNNAFHLEAKGVSGVPTYIDAAEDIGGKNLGNRPMELLLMGLGGCASIDVILILGKQKQQIEDYTVEVTGEREKVPGTEMSPFTKINLHFILKGELDVAKVERAIKLSKEKYCSATAQFVSAEITSTYEIIK